MPGMTWIISPEPAASQEADDVLYAFTHEVASRYYGRDATDAEVRVALGPDEMLAPTRAMLLVARSLFGPEPEEVASRTGPAAQLAPEFSGCVGVRLLQPGVAELKRLWVVPDQRGGGLGSLLVTRAEQVAREQWGADRVRLDTRSDLVESCKLYAKLGYGEIDAYNSAQYAEHRLEKRFG